MKTLLFFLALTLTIAFCLVTQSPAAIDDFKNIARAVAQKSQKSVVTVKFVVKLRAGQEELEQKFEISGTIIDPSGLTLVTATVIDPYHVLQLIFTATGRTIDLTTLKNLKIDLEITNTTLILDDGTELEADVVMKDRDLGLAFVRPRGPPQKFDAISLKPPPTPPQLLDDIFILSRLERNYNRALLLIDGKIRAVVKGQRTYYLCDDILASNFGSIVFAADGSTLGVFVPKSDNETEHILRPVEDILETVAQAKQAKPVQKKFSPTEAIGSTGSTGEKPKVKSKEPPNPPSK